MSAQDNQLVPVGEKAQAEIEKFKLQIVSSSQASTCNSKLKRKVLEENEYTNQIDSIIERDFYPDVSKLRFDLEYHDAVDQNDYEKIDKLNKQKLDLSRNEQNNTNGSPKCFETPIEQLTDQQDPKTSKSDVVEKQPEQCKQLSLNSFLNKFTSEDNQSFEQLQEEAYQKHLEKMKFLSNNSELHNQKVEASRALPSAETQMMLKNGMEDNNEPRLVTWKYSDKNTVMFDPDGVPLTEKEKLEFKQREVIVHENTRFKYYPFQPIKKTNVNIVKKQGSLRSGKVGVDGKEVGLDVTPSVNGFKFVPSTPSLNPDAIPNSPLMTWGEIAATPLNINGDMTPSLRPDLTPNINFRIPEVPERELIGQELANRILTNKRQKSIQTPNSSKNDGTFQSSFERLSSMSPAAQLLATQKLGVHNNIDRSLQQSYSPSPRRSTLRTPTPRKLVTPSPLESLTPVNKQKRLTLASVISNVNTKTIPKRSRADDFF